jgi:hypothetical protein
MCFDKRLFVKSFPVQTTSLSFCGAFSLGNAKEKAAL